MYIQNNRFCYWDAKDIWQVGFIISNFIVVLLLIIFILKIYRKSMKVLDQKIAKFYQLLLIWGISFLAKDTFEVAVYFILIASGTYQQGDIDYYQFGITQLSAIFQVIEAISFSILQTLFFLIPATMIKNLIKISEQKFKIERNESQQRLHRFLTYYQLIRLLIVAPLPIILVVGLQHYFNTQALLLEILTFIKTALQIVDSAICSVVIFICYRFLMNKFKRLRIRDEGEEKLLRRQSIALGFACVCRTVVNLLLNIILPVIIGNNSRSECLEKGWSFLYTIGYLFFGKLFLHFFPVWVIINMYRIN